MWWLLMLRVIAKIVGSAVLVSSSEVLFCVLFLYQSLIFVEYSVCKLEK